ncbi:hypothetical protein K504DRAFT_488980 [Pleomassaria siparia CBS 279.74]|uniref:Wax synthase domain-containing protein n=1 Tax=Pleomassaria siparia CBS 279.74 TaxID=1314801 RepID=A0A6G1KI48_9PLEO|nr:hypothetical protein K504DRAFT_488980 [Pleomassaria siparia CBS 279.74]
MADSEELWTLAEGAQPLLWSMIFCFTCLVVVSFPSYFNRWISISMLVISAYGAFQTSHNLSPDDTLNEIYTRYILIGSSHILSMCYQNNGSKEVPNHLDHKDAKPEWSPWYRGWKLLFNIRGVGTPWEVPYLWPGLKNTWLAPTAPGDSDQIARPKAVTRHNLIYKGKWTGIVIRCGYLLLNLFLLACYYEYMDGEYFLHVKPADLTLEKEGILRRLFQTYVGGVQPTTPVTQREFQVRVWQAAENIIGDFLLLSNYHDFFAIVFIAVGLDESWEWPPFFGQITKAYTMRRFWSMWWHKVIYRSFSSHAALMSSTLGIKQRTTLGRTVNGFLVFGMSAVMHAMVLWKYGNSCAWGRSMMYWMLQPVAFLVEGIVQSLWARFTKRLQWLHPAVLGAFEMVVGFAWVFSWRIWEAPKRTTSLMNCL